MSEQDFCFPVNPDISGIGVRVAIYVQNLLITASTVCVLLDKKVTRTELKVMEAQSTTMIITGSALLISTLVQVFTKGLTNLHGVIILDLCSMNNSNLIMYFSLYFYHLFEDDEGNSGGGPTNEGGSTRSLSVGKGMGAIFRNPVFWFGSVQLTMTSAFEIWLWHRPLTFGGSQPCSQSARIILLGIRVPFTSKAYRGYLIAVSAPQLMPVLNTVTVAVTAVIRAGSFQVINRVAGWGLGSFINSLAFGLGTQGVTSIFYIINTELTLRANRSLMEKGDGEWTFGQTLALVMLLIPLWSVVQILLAHFNEPLPPPAPPISPTPTQLDVQDKE